jgi:hypothetical protein
MKPRSVAEVATYIAEAATTVAFARHLHLQERRYEPDWTWLTVAVGVVLSSVPAIVLARIDPSCWRRYEGRVLAGFLISGAVIIPWQVWLAAYRWGQEQGYRWGSSDQTAPLERPAGGAAEGGRDERTVRR